MYPIISEEDMCTPKALTQVGAFFLIAVER